MPSGSRTSDRGLVVGHVEQRGLGGRLTGAHPLDQVVERRLGHQVQRPVVDRDPAVGAVGDGAEQVCVRVGGAGDLPQAERVAVGLAGGDRVEHAGRRRPRPGASMTGTSRSSRSSAGSAPIAPARSAYSPGPTSGSGDRRPAVHEEPVEGLRERLDTVVVGGRARSRTATRRRPAPRSACGPRGPRRRAAPGRPACRCRTSSRHRGGRASRSARGRCRRGPCRRRLPRRERLTSTGPPSTPMSCADTPTQACPSRRISSSRLAQSGLASMPPLTFIHSTTTVPLKSASSAGRAHQDPGAVVGGEVLVEGPSPVAGERSRRPVRARGPGGHELLFHVARCGEVRARRCADERALPAGELLGHRGAGPVGTCPPALGGRGRRLGVGRVVAPAVGAGRQAQRRPEHQRSCDHHTSATTNTTH